ncbi:transglycosylase SLT domain-containing protein [Reinekea marina]|uniref:Transglycosylase SLT domain-containing protein n=1 Tax=Reinekea marina TaxID=1310421 RepID=A0ABV7WMY0_9GAMM|nr:lytic transglycosylase domain-containing protein [Reinekea marina]MDN3649391.1 transglycosylase SLT domain-containing protein [Reinekea marina]
MLNIIRLFVFCSTVLFSAFSNASYEELKSKIFSGELNKAELARLKNDPLYPHLLGLWFEKNIENVSYKQIKNFRSDPNNQAAYWLLKPIWQKEIIRRNDARLTFSEFASATSAEQKCHYFAAQQTLGKKVSQEEIANLWMSGTSRPDHCDPFLLSWLALQPNQENLIWQRQLLAFYQRNGSLLRYLNKLYPTAESFEQGTFLAKVYQNPKSIISKNYNPNSEAMRELALASVNRMAFKDPKSASNLWLTLVKSTPKFSPDQIKKASKYLGVAMAKQGLPEAHYWLTIADPSRSDETVQHWRLQIALSEKQFSSVIQMYSELSDTLKHSDQWEYWLGYAMLHSGVADETTNPLHQLSKKRSYYGYLAAGVLNQPTQLANHTPYPNANADRVRKEPAMVRALALFKLGEIERAQVEWNLWLRKKDDQTQHDAAELALESGWYSKASQAAGWSRRYDLIHLRYPLAFDPIIDYHAQLLDIPSFWIYGVIRQESRYMQAARSPVGARGLMQLMPATAKVTAKKYDVDYTGTEDLDDPLTNIALGSHYLRELLSRFDHPVYATAAYNAGPSRVIAWKKRYSGDISIWIESIPFDETRNYVKSVLVYSQVYALHTGNVWQMNQWTQPNSGIAALQ